MSRDAIFPTIKGNLTITQIGDDEEGGLELSRTDRDDAVLVSTVPDGAGCGVDEAAGHARLLARSSSMLHLLREALALFAAEFEADEDVPGADLVEQFAEWRGRAKVELAAPPLVCLRRTGA